MAMTDRKRRFAAALRAGASNKEAAIAAGYSEKTASASGSRLAKDPDVIKEVERKDFVDQAKAEAKAQGKPLNLSDLSKSYDNPRDFLKAVMNDDSEDLRFRIDAAKTLMPYEHERKSEGGKKEAKQAAAKKAASGRLAPSAPPSLKVING